MNKTVYIVFECTDTIGVFDSLDTAITSIIDNGGYSDDELNCVGDMRQYLAEHRCTPNLLWDFSIQEYELNEWT